MKDYSVDQFHLMTFDLSVDAATGCSWRQCLASLQRRQEALPRSVRRKTLTKRFQKERLVRHRLLEILEGNLAIFVVVHFAECQLHQIPHTFVWVLVLRMTDETVPVEQGMSKTMIWWCSWIFLWSKGSLWLVEIDGIKYTVVFS